MSAICQLCGNQIHADDKACRSGGPQPDGCGLTQYGVRDALRRAEDRPRADKLCYLATPYTQYRDGIEAAFVQAASLAGRLLQARSFVYSPIAHTHPIAMP